MDQPLSETIRAPRTRRQFLAFGLGVTTTALLAACQQAAPAAPTAAPAAKPTEAPKPAATTAPAAAAKPTEAPKPAATTAPVAAAKPTEAAKPAMAANQRIVYALDFEPSGWDPHVNQAFNAHRMIMNVFDTLVFQTADGKFHPGLAESWEMTPDGRTYTFKLRKDVKFHDGTPFNAQAMKFSFDRMMNPDTKSQLAASLMGPYESSTAVDDFTIRVAFKAAYPAFLDSLSYAWLAPVSPAAVQKFGADFGRNLVGTGPFRQKEWVPKERYVLERNPDYDWAPAFYKHQGPAYLEQITYRFVAEQSTRSAALETGELDISTSVEATDVARLRTNNRLQVINTPLPGAPKSLYLNMTKAPLNEVNVRKALIHAVNKTTVIQTMQAGAYQPAFGPLSRATFGYAKSWETGYDFDMNKARQLLDEAGWAPGANGIRAKGGQPLQLQWIAMNTNRDPQWGELLQAMFKELGIDLQLKVMPAFPQLSAAIAADEYHIVPSWWVQSDPTLLTQLYHSKNVKVNNWSKSAIPELDRMLDQMDTEPDTTKRAAQVEQIGKMILDQALSVPVWDHGDIIATKATVDGLTFDRRGQYFWLYDAYIKP